VDLALSGPSGLFPKAGEGKDRKPYLFSSAGWKEERRLGPFKEGRVRCQSMSNGARAKIEGGARFLCQTPPIDSDEFLSEEIG